MEIIILVVFSILLLPGLLGSFLPLPGMAYMFTMALVYGFIDGFERLTLVNIVFLGAIFFISVLIDFFSGLIGAKYGGASKQSVLAGMAGMIVGTLLLPPFGGLLGIFIAVMVWEIRRHANRKKALRAASASLLGSLSGMIATLILSIVFIVLFVAYAIR